ncbi:MAG TPA: hypothetical protein VHX12_07015 [Acidisoma sp.]|jgi:hypothetical protein|nr:hypothetical protein [Acidisoma sp.]
MQSIAKYFRPVLIVLGLAGATAGTISTAHAGYYYYHHHRYAHRHWAYDHGHPHGYYRYY